LLIPRFGLLGAATATAISFSLESLLLFVWLRRILNRLPKDKIAEKLDTVSNK